MSNDRVSEIENDQNDLDQMTTFYNLNDELNTSERWKLHGKKYKGAILRSRPEPTNYRVHSYHSCVHGASVGESM